MKILSHQVHIHSRQGLPERTENTIRHKLHYNRENLEKQAAEIQDYLTSKLEERLEQVRNSLD